MEFLVYLIFLVPALVAQFSERHRWLPYRAGSPGLDKALRYGPNVLLGAINLGLLGIVVMALLNQLAKVLVPEQVGPQALAANWPGVAIACLLTALLACLPLFSPLRRRLARLLPIDPDSFVHTTALAFAVYQIGLSLAQLALIGSLATLIEAEVNLTIWDVLLSGLPLLLFALVGVGLFVRRRGRSTLQRLGLYRPTWRQLIVAAGFTAALLFFDLFVNLFWERVDPAGYELVNRVSENIFGNLVTVGGAVALGLSAGISEELLFRGAVQPRLGLVLTTVLG
jgi:membrane protease YdiL (CAAX protease family)